MPDPLFATDEDIALRASADFAMICPRDQKLASGTDGVFFPGDRWTLISQSADFQAQGVAPGQVVQLVGPVSAFHPPGEALVVASVSGHSVTLRRKGQPAGTGHPPAPAGGLVGVEFLASTLEPQIASAGAEVALRLGLSATAPLAAPFDRRQLCEVAVLMVLHRQYLEKSRDPGGANPDGLAAKAQSIKGELDERLAEVEARGRSRDGTPARLSARICR